ncbi:NEAT domain-containing protein [Candidatus Contubernalis alkaliaceticus]|uniref:NEAT domain-containing protein n=1 Tax=Candidatus Contubernalis alkaliaceticus TaxID=338645 RepID=UPI001F4C4D53|nr:NEAT domain-containing protein [Candidatus Contubernalis alkalaceticus]UNC93082.1 NEAT domain-containing protein [Candidatus Contubernalis alkalaceticus]
MKCSVKKVFASLCTLLVVFVFLIGVVSAAALEDGEYTIQASAINAATGAPSMAKDNIKNPVKIEVKNGKINIFLTMSGQEVTKDFSFDSGSGNFVLAEVISDSGDIKTYKFPVATIQEPTMMQTYVTAAGMTVEFRLSYDTATLSKVAATGTNENTDDDNSTTGITGSDNTDNVNNGDSNKVSSPQTSDSQLTVLTKLLHAFVFVTMLLTLYFSNGKRLYVRDKMRGQKD